MAERLKQIWAGFAETTSRHLTGKGVDNIIVPHRSDYTVDDSDFLPTDYIAPAETAFAALRADLKAKEKRFGRKKKALADQAQLSAEPQRNPFAGDEVFRGLSATMMRVERSDMDYESYLSSDAGKAAAKKLRKKRFIFF